MKAPYAERIADADVRTWPRACTAAGAFRCARRTASSSAMGCSES